MGKYVDTSDQGTVKGRKTAGRAAAGNKKSPKINHEDNRKARKKTK